MQLRIAVQPWFCVGWVCMSACLCLCERCSQFLLWLKGGCHDTSYSSSEAPRQEVNWAESEFCRAQTTDDTDADRGATQLTQHSMGKFNQTFLKTFYKM